MSKQVICKHCKQSMRKGERLKAHWKEQHPEEYIARQRWLGESEAKLRAAILVAREGMKGPGEPANMGPEQFGATQKEEG